MFRLPALILALFALAVPATAGPQKYGQPLVLKSETRISDLLAHPDQHLGKKVRIRGMVTEVCPERGCFLMIAGDKRFQDIMVRVEEGVVVFPAHLKGREVVAEGVVDRHTFSAEDLKAMCYIEAKAIDPKHDPKKVSGPKTIVRLLGVGAECR